MGLGSWARVGAEQTMMWQIAGFFPKFLSFIYTVMLIEMPRLYVGKLLLHYYRSDLAHTSDTCSSVIELHLLFINKKHDTLRYVTFLYKKSPTLGKSKTIRVTFLIL